MKTKKMLLRFALAPLVCAAMLSAASAPAQEERALEIDPGSTRVEFTLADVLHTVHGKFQLTRGTMRFDPATGKASGELVVDAASGNSGSSARDSRMRKSILESARYPTIVFRPDQVTGNVAEQGSSKIQVHGIFSIHGQDHEIVLPMDIEAANGQYTADTHFSVPYVKWGMKNPSSLLLRVSDTVEIRIHTTARPFNPSVSRNR
jgi:polyisoprenoid-binding protein YceI